MNKPETIIKKYIEEFRKELGTSLYVDLRIANKREPETAREKMDKLEQFLKSALEGVVRDTLEQVENFLVDKDGEYFEFEEIGEKNPKGRCVLESIVVEDEEGNANILDKDEWEALKSSLVGKENKT